MMGGESGRPLHPGKWSFNPPFPKLSRIVTNVTEDYNSQSALRPPTHAQCLALTSVNLGLSLPPSLRPSRFTRRDKDLCVYLQRERTHQERSLPLKHPPIQSSMEAQAPGRVLMPVSDGGDSGGSESGNGSAPPASWPRREPARP
ncbi:hypothetical protein chiPu_0012467 [Chiloscyllium punctatum]|uniref:Uncharacterized protein n=1 Tax=Chiloscyllium punctatum TaxID=137246 RepID=A0A401SUB1_CHIPU|nr:hypothetical protein [Chiloscyllium punctatum]